MQKKVRFYQASMFWKIAIFTAFFLIAETGFAFVLVYRMKHDDSMFQNVSIIKPVLAAEIYPEFTCPCCDKPLDKDEPCCGAMTEMIDFIDNQIATGISEEDVYLATVKEFGIERLTQEEKQNEIRQILASRAPKDAPKLILEEELKNLGEVSTAKGEIHTDFVLNNGGKSDLVIDKLSSSCGCTSASIIYKGEEGSKFTMSGHGKENPTNWQVSIAPGDIAVLRVYYDPTVHESLTGPVTRTVSIFSNDPVDFEKQIRITLDQVL